MKLLAAIALLLYFAQGMRCHAHEQQCERFCNEDHLGGSVARMRCYAACEAKEATCKRDGGDEP